MCRGLSLDRLRAVAAIALCVVPAFASAHCLEREQPRLEAFGYSATLDVLKSDCLGTENDNPANELIKRLLAISPTKETVAQRVEKFRGLAAALSAYAQERKAGAFDAEQWRQVADAIDQEVATLARFSKDWDEDTVTQWTAALFRPGVWQVSQATGAAGVTDGAILTKLDAGACADVASRVACPAYDSRKNLIRVITVGYEIGRYAVRDQLGKQIQALELRDNEWTQYHDNALFQWPWELAYNGYRMKNSKSLCHRDDRGMQMGYCDVPSEQVIALHPDVALQWVDNAQSSSDLHAAAILEVYGRYRWKWSKKGEISHPWGWSAIVVYSNLSGSSDTGYGLMYHGTRGNSIAATVIDGRIGILVSLAVADRFFTASDAAKAKFAEIIKVKESALP
jgi:hypothetical protein